MAAVNEISQSLQALRDIRKFFIESDYATEVGRLREFVALCEQVQRLKENGTLDAISDAILRLAVAPAKEGQP
jgi:hypothetical protein